MAESVRVQNAIEFARKAHEGAVRKGTSVPYITHPLEVYDIVKNMTGDEDVIIAAVLHDVVEDTAFGVSDIEDMFGPRVAEIVCAESENKRRDLPAEATWKIRKTESLNHLRHASLEVKMIALADKLSNMRATAKQFEIKGVSMWQCFNEKDHNVQGWYYLSVADAVSELSDTKEWQEYRELCRKVFE